MNALLKLLTVILLLCTTHNASGQQNPASPEHKLKRIHALNNGVYRLDLPKEYIRETVVPEIIEQRELLAPHYPPTDHIFGAELDQTLTDWIIHYPIEYEDYRSYLETYLRSFK